MDSDIAGIQATKKIATDKPLTPKPNGIHRSPSNALACVTVPHADGASSVYSTAPAMTPQSTAPRRTTLFRLRMQTTTRASAKTALSRLIQGKALDDPGVPK